MRKHVVTGAGLPRWSAPISHAVVVNDHCYVSGQLSVDEAGNYVPGSVRQEAERAFGNAFAALRAAGFTPAEVAFVDVAFADLRDVTEVNAVFARLFPEGRRPARTIYQAAVLPYGAKVKVVCVAVRERAAPRSTKPKTKVRRRT